MEVNKCRNYGEMRGKCFLLRRSEVGFKHFKEGAKAIGKDKMAFKSDKYFIGAHTVFIDVDFTRFQTIPEYIQTLTLPPSCVYMRYSDKLEKKGLTSRRFRMVYVFDRILGRDEFTRISQTITDQIVIDTAEPMDDDCGTRMSQYMNGVYGNPETYQSGCIYSPSDFPEPSQDIEFNITPQQQSGTPSAEFSEAFLNELEAQDYQTFLHYHSWQYRYFYRSETEQWREGLYQIPGKDYLELWWYREKQVDGQNRRRKLFKRACLRRLMSPEVDADTLLFNLYIDAHRFFDNSDGVISVETLKKKVKNALEMTEEQLRAYCDIDIRYWQEHRPKFICKPGTTTTQGQLRSNAKRIRWAELDENYDLLKSVAENLDALDVPMRTLYRYCEDRGIDTAPGHTTYREQRKARQEDRSKRKKRFAGLYDSNKSLRENQAILENSGLNLSVDTISRWAKELQPYEFPPIPFEAPTFESLEMPVSQWDMPEVKQSTSQWGELNFNWW